MPRNRRYRLRPDRNRECDHDCGPWLRRSERGQIEYKLVGARTSGQRVAAGSAVEDILLVRRKRLARDRMRHVDYVVASSTIDGDTDDVLHAHRNRLSVDAAMAV